MKFLLLLALCASLVLAQEVEPLPESSSIAQPAASEDSEADLANSTESTNSSSAVSADTADEADEAEPEAEAEAEEADEDAIRCGHIGGGSRKRTHFCTADNFVLDEEKLETVCPDDECTDDICCVFVEPEAVVVDQESDTSSTVEMPSGPPANEGKAGTCAMITGGPRPARHVCKGHNLVFNPYAANVACGENGCSDSRCCRQVPFVPAHNCGNQRNWTPEKARYCCIVEGVGCKPQTCSNGLGFLSQNKEVCCPNHCGVCGGAGCFEAGGAACCKTLIVASSRSCSHYPAPCANYPHRTPEWEMPSSAPWSAPWSGAELVPSGLPSFGSSFDFDWQPEPAFQPPFQPAPTPMDWLPTSDFDAFTLQAAPAPACIPRRRQFMPPPRFARPPYSMPPPAFNGNFVPFGATVQPMTAFPGSFSAMPFPTSFPAPSAVTVASPAPYLAPYLAPEFNFPASALPADGGLPWCDFEYPSSIGSFEW